MRGSPRPASGAGESRRKTHGDGCRTDRVDRDALSSRLRPESAGGGGRRLPRRIARSPRRALRARSRARRRARRSISQRGGGDAQGVDPALEPDRDRRQRTRPHAAGARRRPTSSASSSGPGAPRARMAIVHIAIFDAVNAITGGYQSYTRLSRASKDTSMEAAIAQAAHDTLVAMFPSQSATLRRPARGRPGRDSVAEATRAASAESSSESARRRRSWHGARTTARITRSRWSTSTT